MNTFLTIGMEPTNQTIPLDVAPSAGGGDWIWGVLFLAFIVIIVFAVISEVKKRRSKKL